MIMYVQETTTKIIRQSILAVYCMCSDGIHFFSHPCANLDLFMFAFFKLNCILSEQCFIVPFRQLFLPSMTSFSITA